MWLILQVGFRAGAISAEVNAHRFGDGANRAAGAKQLATWVKTSWLSVCAKGIGQICKTEQDMIDQSHVKNLQKSKTRVVRTQDIRNAPGRVCR